jgi:hypothetical protein
MHSYYNEALEVIRANSENKLLINEDSYEQIVPNEEQDFIESNRTEYDILNKNNMNCVQMKTVNLKGRNSLTTVSDFSQVEFGSDTLFETKNNKLPPLFMNKNNNSNNTNYNNKQENFVDTENLNEGRASTMSNTSSVSSYFPKIDSRFLPKN